MLAGKALGLTDALMVSGVGIVVVMAELALLAVLVFLLSRLVSALVNKKSTEEFTDTASESSAAVTVTSAGSGSQTSRVEGCMVNLLIFVSPAPGRIMCSSFLHNPLSALPCSALLVSLKFCRL